MVIQLFFLEFILNPAVFIPDENLTLTNLSMSPEFVFGICPTATIVDSNIQH